MAKDSEAVATAVEVATVATGEVATVATAVEARRVMQDVCCTVPSDAPCFRVEPQVAPVGVLSTEELKTVAALKDLILQERSGYTAAAGAEADAHMDEITLLRFAMARPGKSLAAALEMYRATMAWRAERQVNQLVHDLHPARLRSGGAGWRGAAILKHFYAGHAGVTRAGKPFFVERLGMADLGGFAREEGMLGLMLEAYIVYLESLFRTVRACSAATGSFVKATLVIDVSGAGLSMLTHLSALKEIATSIGPAYYPEAAGRVLLVNAPGVAAMIYRLLSPLLPKNTRDKVSLVSRAGTLPLLLEEIDAAELPDFLGGERQTQTGEYAVPRAERVPEGGPSREG